jgi:hypothetical protein
MPSARRRGSVRQPTGLQSLPWRDAQSGVDWARRVGQEVPPGISITFPTRDLPRNANGLILRDGYDEHIAGSARASRGTDLGIFSVVRRTGPTALSRSRGRRCVPARNTCVTDCAGDSGAWNCGASPTPLPAGHRRSGREDQPRISWLGVHPSGDASPRLVPSESPPHESSPTPRAGRASIGGREVITPR